MKLDLLNKLTLDEQEEVKRRVFTIMEQMYLDGITAGRELNKEPLHPDAEKMIQGRISFMSNYFLKDDIWGDKPPRGYKPDMKIPEYNGPIPKSKEEINGAGQAGGQNIPGQGEGPLETPEWAKKPKPF